MNLLLIRDIKTIFSHKLMTLNGDMKQSLAVGSTSSNEQCTDEILGHMLCFTAVNIVKNCSYLNTLPLTKLFHCIS